jgi:CBS domain containing-hemolysin-like protein
MSQPRLSGAVEAEIALVVVLLVLAALLAMAETSLVRTSRVKALSLVEQRRRGARQLADLVGTPDRFLTPVLLVVLICQMVAATLVSLVSSRLFGAIGVVVATIFEIVVIFVMAEALPKNYAVRNPERAALFSAPLVSALIHFWPLRVVSRGLNGLANRLLSTGSGATVAEVSEEEILALADVAVEEAVIETEEREMIHSIIELGDRVVREVMVPRPDMVVLKGAWSASEAVKVTLEHGFSRLPVVAEDSEVIGIVYAKDLLAAISQGLDDQPVAELGRPAQFVPETQPITSLMREMRKGKFHMAVVVDEYGSTVGLVTLEDLIEELVGEISDEHDVPEDDIEVKPDGSLLVNARVAVDEVADLLLGFHPNEGDYDSVGGLVLELLGHLPEPGEVVVMDGYQLMAVDVDAHRIGHVLISPIAVEPEP